MIKNHIKYLENVDIPALPGVYLLTDTKNDLHYIGSSLNIRSRIANHRTLLNYGSHQNEKLQRMYDEGCLCVNILVAFPFSDKRKIKEAEKLFIEAAPVLFKDNLINKHKGKSIHTSLITN
ncbi:hypothetical protein FOA22_03315 [Heyndrickxia oleronia]|uniref:GIY-YIG nuclease family protein n=1 Tax=Heyndrickxia oleronia TaxID=38875 RepID=UPI0007170A52